VPSALVRVPPMTLKSTFVYLTSYYDIKAEYYLGRTGLVFLLSSDLLYVSVFLSCSDFFFDTAPFRSNLVNAWTRYFFRLECLHFCEVFEFSLGETVF